MKQLAMRITTIQSNLVWEDKKANLAHFDQLLSQIKTDETDIIVLPEMFSTGFSMNPQLFAESPHKSTTTTWMQAKALEFNAAIVGSIIIKDKKNYYNRLIWMNPDGSHQFYNKRHLFSYGGEHLHYKAGKKKLIVEYKGWRICPLICYDLRFPVWSRNTPKLNYDLLIYTANWPNKRAQAWRTLIAARAIENLSYTVAVNRVGVDGNGINHIGDTTVVDFAGNVLHHAENKESIQTTTLNKTDQTNFRNTFNFLNDQD
jgi:omega-amidase